MYIERLLKQCNQLIIEPIVILKLQYTTVFKLYSEVLINIILQTKQSVKQTAYN